MSGCIVVAGASRGIGRAVAERAAAAGITVCATMRGDPPADSVSHPAIHWMRCDIRAEDDVRRLFADAVKRCGPVRGLVVNAGIAMPPRPIADFDVNGARNMFDIHIVGTLVCIREFVNSYRENSLKTGAIVLVSSIAARTGGLPGTVAYASSKAAVSNATLGLARELGPSGIRVNAVSPGSIETEMLDVIVPQDKRQAACEGIPLGRLGRPDEVAAAILWLLSSEASYVTGANLDVTGGR